VLVLRLESFPLLGEAGRGAGDVPWLRGAEQIDDGRVAVGVFGEGFDDCRNFGGDGKRLADVVSGSIGDFQAHRQSHVLFILQKLVQSQFEGLHHLWCRSMLPRASYKAFGGNLCEAAIREGGDYVRALRQILGGRSRPRYRICGHAGCGGRGLLLDPHPMGWKTLHDPARGTERFWG
jgi:hypothetical protein